MSIEQFRDPQLATDGDVVGFYEREFYVFSNFSSFQINWRGETWATSEHAYQAAKFFKTAPDLAKRIKKAQSAHEAFKLAKSNSDKLPDSWGITKLDVMLDIVRHKAQQHSYIQKKLVQSGAMLIVEDSPVDSYWGWGPDRQGRNELGKIWMKIREELNRGEL